MKDHGATKKQLRLEPRSGFSNVFVFQIGHFNTVTLITVGSAPRFVPFSCNAFMEINATQSH